jgi:hypothetical protein
LGYIVQVYEFWGSDMSVFRASDATLEDFKEVLVSRLPEAFPTKTWPQICSILRAGIAGGDYFFVTNGRAIGLFCKWPRRFDTAIDIDEVFCLGKKMPDDRDAVVEIYSEAILWCKRMNGRKVYYDNLTSLSKEDFKTFWPSPRSSKDELPYLRVPK